MTSSKHSCTFRKRLSLIFMLLLLSLPAGAVPYRALVVSSDEGIASLILSSLTLLSGEVTSPSACEEARARIEAEARIAEEQRISGYLTAENLSALSSYAPADTQLPDEPFVLEVTDVSIGETEASFLREGDDDAFGYLRLSQGLDLIISAGTADEGLMSEVTVYANGDLVYQAVYLSSDENSIFLPLTEALLPYLKSDYYMIVPVLVPSNVSFTVDGQTVPLVYGYTVLSKGEHTIRYTSPAFENLEETVIVDDGFAINPVLTPLFSGPAIVSSIPFDAEIYYQGVGVENHLAMNGTVPFSITATADGFAPFSIQSTRLSDNLTIMLRPEWMDGANLVDQAKTRFYNALLGTLITFGIHVAANAVSNVYPDYSVAPLATALAGVSIVQLVELVDSMFDYFQAARLGM